MSAISEQVSDGLDKPENKKGNSMNACRLSFAMVASALMLALVPAASAQSCANEAIRAQQPYARKLPDCRAYEQVSPVDKNQNDAETQPGFSQVSASGDSVLYYSGQDFNASQGSPANVYVDDLSKRGPEGWSTQPLTVPLVGSSSDGASLPFQQTLGVTNDLAFALVDSCSFASVPGAGFPCDLYLRNDETGGTTVVVANSEVGGNAFAGSSAEDSHVLIESEHKFLDGAIAEVSNIYDWSHGQLSLVGVLNDGNTPAGGAVAGFGESALKRSTSGETRNAAGESTRNDANIQDAISRDGTRVFFHDPVTGEAFVREDGERTIALPMGSIAANPQGTQVLVQGDEGLAEYNIDTASAAVIAPTGSGVEKILDFSDGSHVYFSATAVLAAGATSGQENTYVWYEEAGAAKIKFVGAALASNGVTEDGRTLLAGGEIYHAESGELNCAICSSGVPLVVNPVCQVSSGVGCPDTKFYPGIYFEGFEANPVYEPLSPSVAPIQSMSDNGSRVIFESIEALVPEDTNGVMDVYEWERGGEGACEKEGGCIFLLSSGGSQYPSVIVGSSATGGDVFFATRQPLVGQDVDGNYDIYDARVGGGIASQSPVMPVPCGGDGCKPLPASAPVFGAPASATLSGTGNLVTPAATPKSTKKGHTTVRKKASHRKKHIGRKHKLKKTKTGHSSAKGSGNNA
jgi:hypothetical protein